MGEDSSAIRQDIEQTRAQMGDTVEALGYKTDVPSRAKDKANSVKSRITGATPDTGDVKDGAKQAVGVAERNPLGLAVAAAGVGFVAGMLLPSTTVENRIGPMAEEAKDQALKTGKEALERGKDVAQQAASSAAETAKEAGQEQAGELKDSAQSRAKETAKSAKASAQPATSPSKKAAPRV